jgi:hypothetical protein
MSGVDILIVIIVVIFVLVQGWLAIDYFYFWRKSYHIYIDNFGFPPINMWSGLTCWLRCRKNGLL